MHADTTIGELRTRYPTVGPQHRFANVLLIEKEGFQQIFEHVKLDTRYDLAIMSSKGMNTTAARTLVEKLPGVRFLVLHDFDKAGFSILGTLTRSTRRYHYHRRADIVDLGIRLKDAEVEDLPSEPVHYPGGSGRNLRLNGAHQDEIEFLVDGAQRVELNAFTSDHLIEWLEQKLEEHGVKKVIPNEETLAAAYRRAALVEKINTQITKARDTGRTVRIPKTLVRRVRALLKADPRGTARQETTRLRMTRHSHDKAPTPVRSARSFAASRSQAETARVGRVLEGALVSCHSGSQHKSSVSYARPGCVERTVRCSPGSHRRFSSRRTACRRHCWCRGTPRWRPPTAARSDASHGGAASSSVPRTSVPPS